MNNKNGPVLGATLYSFTNEWQQRLFTLDEMVLKVAELGLGPAVEAVGFQSFRDYPDVTDEFAHHFRSLLDRHGLFPNCLGANLDIGIRKSRLMTPDETLEYAKRQIVTAQKLGFPVLRIQLFVKPEMLEKIVPFAEKAGVHLASELHSPLNANNPEVVEMMEFYRRIQSPALGFVPDFSCTMTAVPDGFWSNLRRAGAPEGLIDAAKEIWKTDDPTPVKFGMLAEACRKFEANPAVSGQINMALTMFGHSPVDMWREIFPFVRHVHGKFYEVNADGVEPSIPYPELMALLKDIAYTGTISAEWEGQAFTEEPIGFQQTEAWHTMCSRLLEVK